MLLRSITPTLFFTTRSTRSLLILRSMSSIPSTMKSVFFKEHGGVEKLIYDDVPVPKISEDSILVKNHFAGVNFIDTYQRSGLYQVPLPHILGKEGAGEVVQVGSGVKEYKVGDRVVYLGGSTYAEYTNVSTALAQKLTDDVSFEEAAAVSLQGLTAWTLVRAAYQVQKGDIVLVHAAAGGVGLLLCQMLRHLGATVIGTVSTEEKAKLARANGADHIVIYTKEDVVERVNALTDGQGCHAVFDSVGKDTWEASLAVTRRLGSLISFGNASGPVPPISVLCLTPKNLRLMRPQLFPFLATKEEANKWWGELMDLLSKKIIKVHVHKHYDLKDAHQAHTDIQSRKTTGKLLLKI
ncbi:Putative NADPH2:quinone reductase [Rhizopus microsporus]|nr:Putative NADPH2:quinone reductase [Rhizopus microsporus]